MSINRRDAFIYEMSVFQVLVEVQAFARLSPVLQNEYLMRECGRHVPNLFVFTILA